MLRSLVVFVWLVARHGEREGSEIGYERRKSLDRSEEVETGKAPSPFLEMNGAKQRPRGCSLCGKKKIGVGCIVGVA